jgi:hypothetical protein
MPLSNGCRGHGPLNWKSDRTNRIPLEASPRGLAVRIERVGISGDRNMIAVRAVVVRLDLEVRASYRRAATSHEHVTAREGRVDIQRDGGDPPNRSEP